MHQPHSYHLQEVFGRTWLLLLLTLLLMVSPTQEETQEEGVRDSFSDMTINDFTQDEIKEIFQPRSRGKRFIYPGTLWCGDGTTAKEYSDLGRLKELDMCCRDHDNCNDSIRANANKHGLHNPLPHTSSHCDCDASFRECLHTLNGFDRSMVGGVYFQIAVCFKFSHPAHCSRMDADGKRCLRYKYDKTLPKTWQFFDTLPWNYVETTTVTTTVQYTTATEKPTTYAVGVTSRAASITVGSTVTVITVAVVVTVILYNKVKDGGNTCCPCKKSRKYQMVSTVEEFV